MANAPGARFLFAISACAGLWAVIGVLLLGLSSRRCNKIIRDHEALLAETDRILAEDDAMAAAAASPSESESEPMDVAPTPG